MNRKLSSSQPLQIQLGVDGSEYSMAAVQMLSDLPLPPGSRMTILGVLTAGQPPGEGMLRAAMENAEKILSQNQVETESVLLYGHVAKELIEYGRKQRPDLMVIGAKGLYATPKILLGGVAHQVVEHARWPVLVVRTPYRGLRRVLLAADGSQNCRLAAQYLAQFPLPEQTEIQIIHVQALIEEPKVFAQGMGPFAYLGPSMPIPIDPAFTYRKAELNKQRGRVALAEPRRILETAGRKPRGFITDGDPASQILAHSEQQGIDLIVAGSRGLSAIEGWWWGSVSRKLVHYAHSSVLFIRTDSEDNHAE
jgi:nucleotide-binding universal stress UspA family protein